MTTGRATAREAARVRLAEEVASVVGGRDPTAADMESLVWTRAVISEAMRLYPPAWTIERDAAEPDDVCGVAVGLGDTVVTSPYLIHRHPEFWPNPEGFDPALPPGRGGRAVAVRLPALRRRAADLRRGRAGATGSDARSRDDHPAVHARSRAGCRRPPAGRSHDVPARPGADDSVTRRLTRASRAMGRIGHARHR